MVSHEGTSNTNALNLLLSLQITSFENKETRRWVISLLPPFSFPIFRVHRIPTKYLQMKNFPNLKFSFVLRCLKVSNLSVIFYFMKRWAAHLIKYVDRDKHTVLKFRA